MFVILACAVALSGLPPVFAQGTLGVAPPGASSCSGCHATASGVDTPAPRLVGRSADELTSQMMAFRNGMQPATVMDRIAKGFSDAETKAIAEWYAQQKP